MAYKYGILVKTMWLTSFYACIIPVGILLSLVNLILTYLLDKVIKFFVAHKYLLI